MSNYNKLLEGRLNLKPGVRLDFLTGEIFSALDVACCVWRSLAAGEKPTVTSYREGSHKVGSLHPLGLAVDLRCCNLPTSLRPQILGALRFALGDRYQVLQEPDHYHIEYDRKTTAG